MKNKGSVMDYFFFLGMFLFLGISILIGIYVYDEVSTPMLKLFNGTDEATTSLKTTRQVYNLMDFIFLFLWIMMMAIPIISAIFVQNHPIFFVVNLLLLLVYMAITPAISNAMRSFWSTGEFADYSFGGSSETTFPIMTRIFQHLPLLSFLLSFMLMLAQFSKGQQGGI